MSSLLLDEEPLLIMPKLAVLVGLNEAIILQQINYWLKNNKINKRNFHDGFYWTYNTYEEWQEQFPFWSVSTIKRGIYKLEKMEVLISTNKYNKLKIDKTKWYRIDHEKLDEIEAYPSCQNETSQLETSQDDTSIIPKRNVHNSNLNRALPETSSKTSTEINSKEEEAFNLFRKAKGKKISNLEKEKLIDFIDFYSFDIVIKAIDIMSEKAEKPSISYLKATLKDWDKKGLDTIEKVLENISRHEVESAKANENKNKKITALAEGTQNYGKQPDNFNNYAQRDKNKLVNGMSLDDIENGLTGW